MGDPQFLHVCVEVAGVLCSALRWDGSLNNSESIADKVVSEVIVDGFSGEVEAVDGFDLANDLGSRTAGHDECSGGSIIGVASDGGEER